MHFALSLNRGHQLSGLHHLTRSTVAVIYCNNFQYGQGVKRLHFCHGSHGYSQTEVPAFKFMPLHNYHAFECCTGNAIILVDHVYVWEFVWSSGIVNCKFSMFKFRTSFLRCEGRRRTFCDITTRPLTNR